MGWLCHRAGSINCGLTTEGYSHPNNLTKPRQAAVEAALKAEDFEPLKAETSKAETSKAETSKAETSKGAPSKAGETEGETPAKNQAPVPGAPVPGQATSSDPIPPGSSGQEAAPEGKEAGPQPEEAQTGAGPVLPGLTTVDENHIRSAFARGDEIARKSDLAYLLLKKAAYSHIPMEGDSHIKAFGLAGKKLLVIGHPCQEFPSPNWINAFMNRAREIRELLVSEKSAFQLFPVILIDGVMVEISEEDIENYKDREILLLPVPDPEYDIEEAAGKLPDGGRAVADDQLKTWLMRYIQNVKLAG